MARTQTLERPLHVEAPSRLRTVLRYNLWLMFACGAAIAGFLILAVTPSGSFGFGSTFFVVAMLAMTAVAACTYVWQRGQSDGYPPLLLVSMVLGLGGGLMSGGAFRRLSFAGPEALALPEVSGGFWLLVAACIVALAALVQLLVFARERRGRWIAFYVFVWSATSAVMPQVLLFGLPLSWRVSDEVRLAVVADESQFLDLGGGGIGNVLSLTIDGALQFGDRSMPYDDEAAVRAELERLASHEDRYGYPLGIIVAIDRDERFGRAVEFLDRCRDAGVRHVGLAAEPGSYERSVQHWYPGSFRVATGAPYPADSPRPSAWLELRLVQEDSDAMAFELDGGDTVSLDELMAALEKRSQPGEQTHLRIVADSNLAWESVMRVVDRLWWKAPVLFDGFAVAD